MIDQACERPNALVARFGIGCMNFGWQIDASRATEIVREALESGVRFFDTSVSYGRGASETMLGDILHGLRRRKDVVIATKFGSPATQDARDNELGNGRLNVIRHCELSLSRLKTDYLDLFQMHHFDEATPFDETFSALDALLRQGKVRRVGLCNLRGAQLAAASACAGTHDELVLHSHQVRFNLLDRSAEPEVLSKAHALGMRNMAYAPLAEGFLSGQYRFAEAFPETSRFALASPANQYERRFTADLAARLARIGEVARECGIAMATLALSWLADRADVDKILLGASSAAQVRALGAVPGRLDAEIRRRLDEIVPPGTCYA